MEERGKRKRKEINIKGGKMTLEERTKEKMEEKETHGGNTRRKGGNGGKNKHTYTHTQTEGTNHQYNVNKKKSRSNNRRHFSPPCAPVAAPGPASCVGVGVRAVCGRWVGGVGGEGALDTPDAFSSCFQRHQSGHLEFSVARSQSPRNP